MHRSGGSDLLLTEEDIKFFSCSTENEIYHAHKC